jgi:hypothetical protein
MTYEQEQRAATSAWRWGNIGKAALAGASVAVLVACGGGGDTDLADPARELPLALTKTASTPTSTGGVVPNIVDPAGPGGNVECSALGYTYSSARSNYGSGGFDAAFPTGISVTVTSGTYVAWTSTFDIGAVIVKGGPAANVYEYSPPATSDSGLASPPNASGGFAGLSNLTFCWNGPIPGGDGELKVKKFYDANTNGVKDVGEVLINGWEVKIGNSYYYTTVMLSVPPGSYTVMESLPVEPNWYPTTPTSLTKEVDANSTTYFKFGNVCTGAGGGKTLGFWSNKNGQALVGADDLAALVALNLVDASGSAFNPTSYAAFRTWLLNASATNMAYMLSAQLAAMKLNVFNGLVSGTALIYAPGTGVANAAGFATVNAVIGAADAALGSDGYTPSGDANRTLQEALKNALDNANNNYSFVQSSPCAFSFPTRP